MDPAIVIDAADPADRRVFQGGTIDRAGSESRSELLWRRSVRASSDRPFPLGPVVSVTPRHAHGPLDALCRLHHRRRRLRGPRSGRLRVPRRTKLLRPERLHRLRPELRRSDRVRDLRSELRRPRGLRPGLSAVPSLLPAEEGRLPQADVAHGTAEERLAEADLPRLDVRSGSLPRRTPEPALPTGGRLAAVPGGTEPQPPCPRGRRRSIMRSDRFPSQEAR